MLQQAQFLSRTGVRCLIPHGDACEGRP